MKKIIIFIIFIFCMFLLQLNTTAGVMARKQDMIEMPDLIVVVVIQDIITVDKSKFISDLIASGYITKYLKGKEFFKHPHELDTPLPPNSLPNIKKLDRINFRIPRDLLCDFDVSTGPNLVFLKKDKNKYIGFHYGINMPYPPYIYLNVKNVKWYDIEGEPQKVVDEIKKIINKTR